MKFKVQYNSWDGGTYELYQRKRCMFIPYWDRISISCSIEYIQQIIDNLKKLNSI